MVEFLQDNTNKLIFTTVMAIIIGIIGKLISDIWFTNKKAAEVSNRPGEMINENNNTFNPTVNVYSNNVDKKESELEQKDLLERRKLLTKILFIDDDSKFKVVNILKKAGWIHTKLIKDIDSVDDQQIKDVDIFFVDVQGVGKALECKDEGLGLALILTKKYPKKKIVIYSAETKGDRFHEALRKANSFLAKNAEPYEFQELVEEFSIDLYPNA
ncbi:hypothetical protein ABDJ41_12055 [Pedobacter sp. ASV1-7]|uniref:hypothetical protein n=1 Tax=Pedobacter sp. ASV1-7 TaxID=3145237 RepID=UPI0032E8B553